MTAFHLVSERVQIARLRKLALKALSLFPVQAKRISFIHHGENTTFKLTDPDGELFLLRIHRSGYHTDAAINVELQWLERIRKTTDISVPEPIASLSGRLFEVVDSTGVDVARRVDVFRWVHGKSVFKTVTPEIMFELGRLTGKLQQSASRQPTRNRMYWDAEGLVGVAGKFGRIDAIIDAKKSDLAALEKGRRAILGRLRSFERKYPERMGLIHADLHFGNFVVDKNGKLGAFDFDDCGFGFYMYDMAVTLYALRYVVTANQRDDEAELRDALLSGYSEEMPFDFEDEAFIEDLYAARMILLCAWMNSRADNPRIRTNLKRILNNTVNHLRSRGLA